MVDLLKYPINIDFRILEPLGECISSKDTRQFRMRVSLISNEVHVNKNLPTALHRI